MEDVYSINWKRTAWVRYSAMLYGGTIWTVAIIVEVILIIVLGKGDPAFVIGMGLFLIFSIGMLILHIYALNKLKKYSFIKEIKFVKDGVIVLTVKGLKFHIKYEDVGLIDATEGVQNSVGNIYFYPLVLVVYHNQKLDKCVEVFLDRKTGLMFVNRYREYAKEKSMPACPILEGIVDTSDKQVNAIRHIKNSPFCHRERLPKKRWVPPPWLKEGGK